MRQASLVRRVALAGALALSMSGLTAGLESAQAMPAAALVRASGSGDIVAVQYRRYPNYRYRGFNRHRRAGLYRCGPGGLSTHLERKACR